MLQLKYSINFMAKNKILMIAYTYYSTDARVIKEAETALVKGYSVDFIALRKPQEKKIEVKNNLTIYKLKQSRYRGSQNLMYLLAYVEFFFRSMIKTTILFIKNRYKIIHVNNIPDFIVFSAIIPKLFGAKVILDIHDPMPNTFLTKFQGDPSSIMYKMLLLQEILSTKFADHVITVHEPLKYDVLIKDGIPEEKISVLPNFADDQLFKLVENYQIDFPLRMIFHGTIAERFGLQFILQAIANFKYKEKINLVIIGEGDYSEKLKGHIEDLNLRKIVNFEHTTYPVHQLPKILCEFHLGLISYILSPATEYMLPVKMLELLAMGIPVITVNNKAIDYYFNSKHCLFYDSNDLSSLIELLEDLIKRPDKILTTRNAWLKIRDNYLWKKTSERYSNILSNFN